MTKKQSLVDGIGNNSVTKNYYDNWSEQYDQTLKQWKYQAPKKASNLLTIKLKYQPMKILDLACGTGLFGEELKKNYINSQIYGSDISKKSLNLAFKKKIYKKLTLSNFEEKQDYNIKFNLVSMIGAMTYCKDFEKLFLNIKFFLFKKGYFIFTHRTDLWQKQDFNNILNKQKYDFSIIHISKPSNYLPLHEDFKDQIKIRLVLLQKY